MKRVKKIANLKSPKRVTDSLKLLAEFMNVDFNAAPKVSGELFWFLEEHNFVTSDGKRRAQRLQSEILQDILPTMWPTLRGDEKIDFDRFAAEITGRLEHLITKLNHVQVEQPLALVPPVLKHFQDRRHH